MTVPTFDATLHLNDPVHVLADGRVVPVRRKGLAMLAYLALEGPTRRERLADVLWGRRRALPNLRVELHRVRNAFETTRLDPIARTTDALSLAPELEVATAVAGDGLLAGLDDVSAPFQEWLDHRRSLADARRGHAVRTALLADLAARVAPPFVLVLEGAPGSGRHGLAKDLARRLELPWAEDPSDERAAVHYVAPELQHDTHLVETIVRDPHGVWVLGRSPFAEDSQLLLRLRARLAPERVRFVVLEPISWPDARASLPAGVDFDEGARLYLTAGGNPGYLSELVKLRELGTATFTDPARMPVPQRLRAAIRLEAERLTVAGRRALERLSVHPGTFSDALLEALEVDTVAEELERLGWLRYDGAEWRFSDPIVARLIRAGVQPGVKLHLHHRIAEHLEREGAVDGAMYHRRAVLGDAGPPAFGPLGPAEVARPIPYVRVHRGRSLWLEEKSVEGRRVTLDAGRSVWSCLATDPGPNRVTWALPTGPVLVRLRGKAYAHADETGAPPEALLRLTVAGAVRSDVEFGIADTPGTRANGALFVRVPVGPSFEHWLWTPNARELWLEAPSGNAVIESEIEAFEGSQVTGDPCVHAIDLAARHRASTGTADPGARATDRAPASQRHEAN